MVSVETIFWTNYCTEQVHNTKEPAAVRASALLLGGAIVSNLK